MLPRTIDTVLSSSQPTDWGDRGGERWPTIIVQTPSDITEKHCYALNVLGDFADILVENCVKSGFELQSGMRKNPVPRKCCWDSVCRWVLLSMNPTRHLEQSSAQFWVYSASNQKATTLFSMYTDFVEVQPRIDFLSIWITSLGCIFCAAGDGRVVLVRCPKGRGPPEEEKSLHSISDHKSVFSTIKENVSDRRRSPFFGVDQRQVEIVLLPMSVLFLMAPTTWVKIVTNYSGSDSCAFNTHLIKYTFLSSFQPCSCFLLRGKNLCSLFWKKGFR